MRTARCRSAAALHAHPSVHAPAHLGCAARPCPLPSPLLPSFTTCQTTYYPRTCAACAFPDVPASPTAPISAAYLDKALAPPAGLFTATATAMQWAVSIQSRQPVYYIVRPA